ncbi:MAG: FHA domain-containing protein [Gemmatimonadaceae bacterium]
MAWLSVGTLTYELREGETVVGSGPEANWRVETADLMPRHFAVNVVEDRVVVRPFMHESVVVVGTTQLHNEPRILVDGDVIAAGIARFVFSEKSPRVIGAEATRVADAYLIEERAGVAHPLSHRSTSIGRDASNDIVIRNPTASRFHADIRREAGGFALHSMGSAGTVLNGRLMKEPALLRDGDLVEIAFTIFEFTHAPLPPGVEVAPEHAGENDETTRKPTIATEWVVDEDGADAESATVPLIVIVGILAFICFIIYMWHLLNWTTSP